jgi:hypothetical protein
VISSGIVITNTWFKRRKRLNTWKSSGDRSRYQLDYVLVKHRFRNRVKDVQTLPGTDINSDHNLLAAKICTILKKIIRVHKQKQDGIWRSYMLNDRKYTIV